MFCACVCTDGPTCKWHTHGSASPPRSLHVDGLADVAINFVGACLQVRATLEDSYSAHLKRGIGPINLQFTIPMYCASRLHVKYLQISKADKNYSPYRWVRYVTMSNSYVIRL